VRKHYVLDAVVTVVDAKHLVMRLDDEKPEGVENEAQEQLAFADKILLNKIDLVPEDAELKKIEDRIKTINSVAPILRCAHSKVDWKEVLEVGGFNIERVLDFEPEFLDDGDQEHEHDQSVSSCSVKFEGELAVNALNEWIGELITTKGADLFRYKGVLAVKGMDEKFIFQGVGMLFSGSFCDITWKADEKRECRFVFIGRNLDKEALIQGVKNCDVALVKLRFAVGDKVEARVQRGWVPGKIVAQWDEGNPYRIELEDGRNVHGPLDDDRVVRAVQA